MAAADITERLFIRGGVFTSDAIDWKLQDDSAVPGTFEDLSSDPDQLILELDGLGGITDVTLDSDDGYPLGTNFVWSAPTLTISLANKASTVLPAGWYEASLWWFDATNSAGIRFPRVSEADRQRVLIVVEEV